MLRFHPYLAALLASLLLAGCIDDTDHGGGPGGEEGLTEGQLQIATRQAEQVGERTALRWGLRESLWRDVRHDATGEAAPATILPEASESLTTTPASAPSVSTPGRLPRRWEGPGHVVTLRHVPAPPSSPDVLTVTAARAGQVGGRPWAVVATWTVQRAGTASGGPAPLGLRVTFSERSRPDGTGTRGLVLGNRIEYALPGAVGDRSGERHVEVVSPRGLRPVRDRLNSSPHLFLEEAREELDAVERAALARLATDPPTAGEDAAERRLRADLAGRRRLLEQHAGDLHALFRDALEWGGL